MRCMYTCFECEIDNICYAVSCDVTLMELVCKTVTLRWLLPVDSYRFFGCDTFGSSGPFPKMAQVKTRMCRFRREWINLLCLTLWICLFRLKLIVLKTTLIVLWG